MHANLLVILKYTFVTRTTNDTKPVKLSLIPSCLERQLSICMHTILLVFEIELLFNLYANFGEFSNINVLFTLVMQFRISSVQICNPYHR